MAATEELRILLRTIADTTGITKTEQALKGVQAQATSSGQSAGASLLKFGAAAGIATVATDRFVNLLGDSIQATREHDRILRATTASYGQQTAQWTRFAQQLSATTGLTSDAILEAALSARTLSANYGLSIEQTQKLISVSADLARIRGIGVAEAFERVQSAIRGEAEASEYLGLTLNATYIKNNALNGSLKNTYETMTDQQKAQVIYNELLKQSGDFAGLAASSQESLDFAFGKTETSARNLQLQIGELIKPSVIAGLKALAEAGDLVAEGWSTEGGLAGKVSRQVQQAFGAGGGPGGGGGGTGGFGGGAPISRYQYLTEAQRAQYARDQASQRRMLEINELPGAAELARLAHLDQVGAAVRDITSAQDAQVELQRQSVELAAQEASIRLSMLPAQMQMAELQRTVTEQQIRARQAALPATEALEDLRYEQERARLIASNRNASPEERSAARRLLRESARSEPGVALAALEAGRGVSLAGRAVERVGLEQQLFQLTQERTLAQIQLAQETNTLLASIAEQRTQAILLTVNLTGEGFSQEVYKELIEAADQAPQPSITQLSGVRR